MTIFDKLKTTKNQDKMKKIIMGGALALMVLASTSCGGGHTCDAYRKADFSKKQSKKAVVKAAVKKVVKLK